MIESGSDGEKHDPEVRSALNELMPLLEIPVDMSSGKYYMRRSGRT